MKRIGLLLVGTLACGVFVAACTGSKSKHGNGDLSTGSYVVSNAQSVVDECAANNAPILQDGGQFDIVRSTTGAGITVAGLSGTISNGIVSLNVTQVFDWAPNFDCQENDTVLIQATTTSADVADMALTQKWVFLSGTECAQAYASYSSGVGQTVSLPCKSSATIHIEKAPPVPPPIPITGMLDTAYGFNAELTLLSGVQGSLNAHATVDVPMVLTSAAFTCYAPDPAGGFPNYDLIESVSGDSFFQLSVTTASWAAGTVAINGSSASFFFDKIDGAGNDRLVSATSGSVTLVTAPTAVDNTNSKCIFGMKDVPVFGNNQPPAAFRSLRRPILRSDRPKPVDLRAPHPMKKRRN